MSTADNINQDDLNKALWSACDIFRGTLSADVYQDLILAMFFLKYISDVWQDHYDHDHAEYGDNLERTEKMMENERFVLPKEASFYALYEQRHELGNGDRMSAALCAIEEANCTQFKAAGKSVFQGICRNIDQLGEEARKNPILCRLLEHFAKTELNFKPSHIGSIDMMGRAYEYLIKNFAANGGKNTGYWYTPPEVSGLLAQLLDPQPGDAICDPACGTASLLIKCANQVHKNHGSQSYALYGQEIGASIWSRAKMNMFLHGAAHHKIELGHTIRHPKLLDQSGGLMLFDIVTSNPPFGLSGWAPEDVENDKYSRFRRGIPPKTSGDYAFILHMIETLKPDTGRMGVVVPHGVLFRGGSEGKIRQQLIEENLLDAVIGLPPNLFYNTAIAAAVLIFRTHKKNHSVMFIDASRAFKSGRGQNLLTEDNIAKIVATYKAGVSVEQYAYVASLDEIKKNDYKLKISNYVDLFEEEEKIDLMAVYAERAQLKAQLADLDTEIARYLAELSDV